MRVFLLTATAASLLAACAPANVDRAQDAKASAMSLPGGTSGAVPVPSAKGISLPDFERVELPGGTILLLAEKHDVPLVALRATLRGGAVADPKGKAGVAGLTARLLEKGAGARNAKDFAEAVAAVGGILSANAGVESLQVGAEFMSRDVDLMIELLGDLLRRPAFAAGEFDKLRRRSIELIRSAKDSDPRQLIGTYGSSFLFAGHPYGRPANGDETSLAAITHDDVLAYYRDHLGADRLILSVVGDFDSAALQAKLATAFAGWRAASAPLPALADTARQPGGRVLLVDKPDATQTYFWIGNVGVARDFEGRGPLDIVNTVFGGRFTSMLNTELRVKSGLSYSARSRISRPSKRGSVAMVSYTATDTTIEAIDLTIATLEKLHADGLDQAATTSAKNYILGQKPLGFETARQIAAELATLEFFGLDRSYVDDYAGLIAGASDQAIRHVIGEVYPARDDLVLVLIGKADAIREDAKKYGEVTEISITSPSFAL